MKLNKKLYEKIVAFQEKILNWYVLNGRHSFAWRKPDITCYEIIIAEILLQRTKAETVEKFYPIFLKKYPNWRSIARGGLEQLSENLQPIGLQSQRSPRLFALAEEMLKRNEQLPATSSELPLLPFFGQYITNAIKLQVYHQASPLLDVNMARVIERVFGERQLADIRYDPYLQKLSSLITNHPASKNVNWAILDFASLICTSRSPKCAVCSLSAICKYYLMFT